MAGRYFFLYLLLDVYSRKIVAHEMQEAESAEHAASLIEQAVRREGVPHGVLVIHPDNGSPMKGSTYVAKLHELGITPSYSRPGVSDDNPYAESLFRTAKYRPEFPGAFATLERTKHPKRWSRSIRDWSRPKEVWLNRPATESALREAA